MECSALTDGRLQWDRTPEFLDKLLHDGQPDAGAFHRVTRLQGLKDLEYFNDEEASC